MSALESSRREFLRAVGVGAASGIVAGSARAGTSAPALEIDPQPRYDLSPWLYMQFMEPLGTTDGSLAAAWDFAHDRWREDVVAVTKELAPPLIRWGRERRSHGVEKSGSWPPGTPTMPPSGRCRTKWRTSRCRWP